MNSPWDLGGYMGRTIRLKRAPITARLFKHFPNFAQFFRYFFSIYARVYRNVVRANPAPLVIYALLISCSPPPENEQLEQFARLVDKCSQTRCAVDFPQNPSCAGALQMMMDGQPEVVDEDQLLRATQERLLFWDTYSRWLEGEVGKSVMGSRFYCSKKVEQIVFPVSVHETD